ncbi:MAG: substrate-binding periplasmic protein [Bacillota bacterium]
MFKKVSLVLLTVLVGLSVTLPVYAGKQKGVSLATLDWPPYIGEKLANNGYVAEIVRKAYEKVGYRININFMPWNRALLDSQNGKYDGLFPEYFSEERKIDFVYSDPYPGGPLGFYKRKDQKISYKTLADLKPYTIGIVTEYVNTAEFDAASYLRKEGTFSDSSNLQKLYNRRVQLIVIDKLVADYIIKTEFPQYAAELEFMEPPLETKPLYIAFSKKAKDYRQKLNDFNAGLKQITKDGTLKAILERNGF